MMKHPMTLLLAFLIVLLTYGWAAAEESEFKSILDTMRKLGAIGNQQAQREAQQMRQIKDRAGEWMDRARNTEELTRRDADRAQQAANWAEKLVTDQDRAREWADRAKQAAERTQQLADMVHKWVPEVTKRAREIATVDPKSQWKFVANKWPQIWPQITDTWRQATEIVQNAAAQTRHDAELAKQSADWAQKALAR